MKPKRVRPLRSAASTAKASVKSLLRPTVIRLRARRARSMSPLDPSLNAWGWEALCHFKLQNRPMLVESRYGVRMKLHLPDDFPYTRVCAGALFEAGTTELLRAIARPQDVFFDVGANLGWYATHFATFVADAECEAFEPSDVIAKKLTENIVLNNLEHRVHVHVKAVGAHEGTASLYSFGDLAHVRDSLSDLGREDAEARTVTIETIDSVCDARQQPPNIIKVDVEGAEMDVLKGATKLLNNHSPIWILEMNDETSTAFGNRPIELLEFLSQHADYVFVRMREAYGHPELLKQLSDYVHGDTVACFVRGRDEARMSSIDGLNVT